MTNCAVLTISDTRTTETDTSGKFIKEALEQKGHHLVQYLILKDEPELIVDQIKQLSSQVQVIICNGGTGIAPRDTTYEALEKILEKTLPGFGELFRYLSYQEIGSRAIASRAIAGLYRQTLIFSLPGSTNAVKLGMNQLITPEISHLLKLVR
ncbi:MogA/MoaB family molybdenum cofactor biosynthesis protein [Euhalothece natronophila Z-M001]|uniref:Molybdenum cofactor biosynthesis protein B n=1 Tax=Euhalothece natronophila Z-M001 TaxID=522448 RepID=A0A5B8NRR7_9CHRO|nr:MogA/MoaB family molybdenum cofactor biosynthesis protein [Euhalothece natronophila]QDZ41009.1 MogA/MoaB family molybdenum cofactor biosynthesis protein [Euhalothece natronophila Z-M001]